ncbi:N-acetylglucosamine-6-phosphate deacetylase [Borreliella burgdorferi]|uniref:N-acetylglucosamine-6-phosphate deacetylase n=2 Tax=Borreliella burgdorferi TaxID=139 RepID=A0A7U8EZR1_BORBG|nr:N-acetylglucosamine-6-phosphate deacetylase [Borreliella burgdorferi]ADQ29227.1 N-acetylglucosamine-6-phosphate deacetylase [Borreliella burgdorferi N40]ATH09722.1 N-acetylglucosamine-6-phosphate deacetylase [Borreliella burgdorferi]EEC22145.1 N-acetylglucosamine-6-phosphate deacetylase [Borreliella burgdorferi 156a]EEE18884.1 N-acetylglucosamine-6-phosphate deacetylase [Borreliella burgdorferi 72a]EEF82650.1 N-acetylglucosamine-6-phosphate deacetylase [Borreliella burgdorferi WI91-23]
MPNFCLFNSKSVLTGNDKIDNSAVLIKDNKIFDIVTSDRLKKMDLEEYQMIDTKGNYITPGLYDNHIHGFHGHGTDQCSTESILKMSEHLAQYGVVGFLPTLYPRPIDEMIETIKACIAAIGKEKGAKILGLHLEGPFFSPEKKGAHPVSYLHEPSIEVMQKLIDAAGGVFTGSNGKRKTHISTMTVAPELKGMRELAIFCLENNINLQAGHTNATYENMIEGFQVGILHTTHFFNAMSKLDHRNPNAIGAVLIHGDVSCEIIADGHHIHPKLILMLRKLKDISKIVLVTDGLTPNCQTCGKLIANGDEVYIAEDGLFHSVKSNTIAGSTLTMIQGLKNLIEFGFSLSDAVQASSYNPTRILNIDKKGLICHGYDANLNVLDKDFNLKLTMIESKIIFNNL